MSQVSAPEVTRALLANGVFLDVGLACTRVRSDAPGLAEHLRAAYRHFPFITAADWADMHVRLPRPRGLRRWWRPQVRFVTDGSAPFHPFALDTAFPMLEWGGNWLIGRRMNDSLLFHSGVLERDGLSLLLPATPGSGKSTLTAALSLRGWRLLSDEFGAYDLEKNLFRAVLKPVALKNESIAVIRAFDAGAELGAEFPKTRKGTVAHLAPPAEAVMRRHEPARPGAIVLPQWEAGSPTRWERLSADTSFPALAFNAFNYSIAGAAGFSAVARLTRSCPAWRLRYSDLDDAVRTIDQAWPEVLGAHGGPACPESALPGEGQ